MSDQIVSKSLIEEGDLPEVSSGLGAGEGLTVVKPAHKRTRFKPYEALKTQAKVASERKAEKKAAKAAKKIGAVKPIAGKKNLLGTAGVKSLKALAKKASKASPKKVEAQSSNGSGSGVCSFCGKPLSRHTSVADGMGPTCARNKIALKGISLETHYDSIIVTEEPKGYMKLRDAFKEAKKFKVSPYRFMIAIGGNRMIRPPLNENFRAVMYKGARYVPKASITEKELKKLQ